MICHVTVDARQFASIEAAIKRFRKKVEKSGVLEEFLQHQFYEKPSSRRRRQKKRSSGGTHAR